MTRPAVSATVIELLPARAAAQTEAVPPAVFTAAMAKAAAQALDLAELLAAATALAAAGQKRFVLELYKGWLAHNPNHPSRHVVCFNYGVALSDAGDLAGARDALTEALALNNDFVPALINLGLMHEKMGAPDQAVVLWYKAVGTLAHIDGSTVSYKTIALKHIARLLETVRYDANAEDALRISLETFPNQREPLQHWIFLRQGQCKWPVLTPWSAVTRQLLMESFYPLSLAYCADDPLFQLGTAHNHSKLDVGRPPVAVVGNWPPPQPAGERRLRIGYVSSDLRAHAVGFLTSELFELHDRRQVEVFAYYCGIRADDETKARIRKAVDHWIDIGELSDHEAARRIVDDRIDILVDLNGYSKDARNKIFTLRPAPIIVNWLGFPGTTASPYHHYIIADEYIIPRGSEIYYSEKVLRLPCYQPNDRKRVIGVPPSRKEAGLPEEGTVFCSFNATQKIAPMVFGHWMDILSRVPDSVLWFLAGAEDTNERLRQMATRLGVARERLIFAGRALNHEHMARFALADMLLDTWPYGSHTTASDALWMGVPVLTVPGRGFASRVCGSLLQAAGLGELVCESFEDYVERAVALGRDKAKLQSYKDRLIANRHRSTLFDTPLLVRKLEALYGRMWEDYCGGNLPVPNLTNVELYHEIGCEQEPEATYFLPLAEYHERYHRGLAYRNSLSPLPADGRLWPGNS